MKNELIIARLQNQPRGQQADRLNSLLESLGLDELRERFFTPQQGVAR